MSWFEIEERVGVKPTSRSSMIWRRGLVAASHVGRKRYMARYYPPGGRRRRGWKWAIRLDLRSWVVGVEGNYDFASMMTTIVVHLGPVAFRVGWTGQHPEPES